MIRRIIRAVSQWRQRCKDEAEITAIFVAVLYLEKRGRDDLALKLRHYAAGLNERYAELHCRTQAEG